MISIIMPVYNTKKNLLESSIYSILGQSYKNFELIIVDDGSNYECAKILDSLSELDSRIKLYHRENEGVSASRNYAIDKASGEYITFIDSDDVVNKYFLEEAIKLMNNYKLEMIIGRHKKVLKFNESYINTRNLNNNIRIFYGKDMKRVQGALLTKNIKEFPNGIPGMQCCKVYKAEIIKNIKLPVNMKVSEDQYWNLLVMNNINKIGICDNLWYYYFQHENSASYTYGISDLSTHYNYWETLYKFIEYKSNLDKDFKKYYYSKMINEYYTIILNYHKLNYSYKEIRNNIKKLDSLTYFKESFNNINIMKSRKKEKLIVFLKKMHLLSLAIGCFVRIRKINLKK